MSNSAFVASEGEPTGSCAVSGWERRHFVIITLQRVHFINPRRACAGGLRVCVSVCVCVCVSVTQHLTFPVFICLTNDTTYLTGNEGQKFLAVLSENAPLQG